MDTAIPLEVRQKKKRNQIAIISVVVLIILVILQMGLNHLRPSMKRNRIVTAVVERGDVAETITASGTVLPELEYVVTSPVSATVTHILHQPGDILQPGDSLIVLDLTPHQLALERLREQIRLKDNQRAQTVVDLTIQMNELENTQRQRSLKLEVAQSSYEQFKKMYEIGGVSKKEIDEARVSAEIAKLELDQSDRAIKNANIQVKNREEGYLLEKSILEKDLRELVQTVAQAQTIIEHGGVLTWIVEDEGATIGTGTVIARIADLDSYSVQATISDIHATKLRAGLPVVVRLSDSSRLSGHIRSVQPTIENGVVTFTVTLDDSGDTRLRSNMRVTIELIIAEKHDVLRIKNGPFAQGYGISDVFVVEGKHALRREAEFGMTGFDWLEVVGGLNAGEEVIISDMSELAYAREVRLK
jgi:HlyD family secretion protein